LRDRIRQPRAIADRPAIDIDRDVPSQSSLIIQHITTQLGSDANTAASAAAIVAPVTCAEGTGKNRCSADVNKTVGINFP